MTSSPTILEILLDAPQLEVECLDFRPDETFSCALASRLGNLIQRSVSLKCLGLNMHLHDMTPDLIESLRSATHLQELSFWHQSGIPRSCGWFGAIFCGRLLQEHHPQSRLRYLSLTRMKLEDCHFIDLCQVLPEAQIERLNVIYNRIGSRGILEFARQLPKIHGLKKVQIDENLWQSSLLDYRECVEALAWGMKENYCIEQLPLPTWHWKGSPKPHDRLLFYYMDLNRAGRRILLASNPTVPQGLWPLIFERVGKILPSKRLGNILPFSSSSRALYYFLQNRPSIIQSTRHE